MFDKLTNTHAETLTSIKSGCDKRQAYTDTTRRHSSLRLVYHFRITVQCRN